MALVIADRVRETTTTTGTGTITLGGAVTNFETFTANLSNSDTTYYSIVDNTNGAFEVGLGTFTASGTTLARTTIIASSNSNSAVNFGSGTKDVFITIPASKMIVKDTNGNVSIDGDVTIADGSNDFDVASHDGTNGLKLGGDLVTASATDINLIDGITNGTVIASKAIITDSNKDISGGRNITISGELDAATLDISGDADINGTLEADAITVNGTALGTVIAGTTVTNATNATNATLSSTVTVSDSTANTNFPVVFHDESNALLDDTGALRYNPSTGELLVPKLTVAGTTTTVDTVTINAQNAIVFEGATADSHETTLTITDPTADRTITLPDTTGTVALTSDIPSSGISSGNVARFTSCLADNDFLRVDGTSIEGLSDSEVLSAIGGQASLTFGISNTNAVKIDSSSVADNEFARFTANGLESRSASEVVDDIGAATKGFATAMAIAL